MKIPEHKEKSMFAEERQFKLIEFLQKHKKATVKQLMVEFQVSSATIRNDLRMLDRRGLITRTHGGAMERVKNRFEEDLNLRRMHEVSEKQRIAQEALSLIADGDTIILDSGTTIWELARLVRSKKNLTIITNDIDIADLLCEEEQNTLIFIGGTVRKKFRCTAGPLSIGLLSGVLVDKAFIGANNFDIERGASTPDIDQATTKKNMINIASKRFLLCVHSKFGTQSFARFAGVEDFDLIVTDKIDYTEKNHLEHLGTSVLIPKSE
jgi:DeoR family fructose operon transcriptional repressor